MSPIKLSDVVYQLMDQTQKFMDLAAKGQLNGRTVKYLNREDNKENTNQPITLTTAINQLVNEKLKSLQGEEINSTSSISPQLTDSAPFTLKDLQRRIEAYDALSDSINGMKSLKIIAKLQPILEEQKSFLKNQFEQMEKLNDLAESYLELASRVIQPNFSFSELSGQECMLCHELFQQNNELSAIESEFKKLGLGTQQPLEVLKACVGKIKDEPFNKIYSQFHAMAGKLTQQLYQEPDDLYIKKLANHSQAIKDALNSHPLDKVQGKLPTIEMQSAFYCMVKYQDEILDLYEFMQKNNIIDRNLKLPNLKDLYEIVCRLTPLKSKTLVETLPIANQIPVEKITLSEASNSYEQTKMEKNQTKAQELYWRAAQGYLQSGEIARAMSILSEAAQKMSFSPTHPLASMITDLKNTGNIGRDFSGLGTGGIKEQSIHAQSCLLDGNPVLRMDFKLNDHASKHLDTSKNTLKPNLIMASLPIGFCQGVKITERSSHEYLGFEKGQFNSKEKQILPGVKEIEVEFVGVGKIILCKDPNFKAVHNSIFFEMKQQGTPETMLKAANMMLTMIGCPPALVESNPEDKQRRALLHVFRCFYPAEAYKLERDPATYALNPAVLRDKICGLVPNMQAHFKEYLTQDHMPISEIESTAGKRVTSINISPQLKQRGALGLIHGMSSSCKVCAPIISKILQSGLLSSQRRFQSGILSTGQSSYNDHQGGGAEGVFTRMVTEQLAANQLIQKFSSMETLQILIDLDAVNGSNTYGFDGDHYGSRNSLGYHVRKNLMELTDDLQVPPGDRFGRPREVAKYGTANEVIVRDRIPPQFIRGLVVQTEENKKTLIEQLKNDHVLVFKSGEWYYGSKNINDFIKVSTKFTKEMWNAN